MTPSRAMTVSELATGIPVSAQHMAESEQGVVVLFGFTSGTVALIAQSLSAES